MAGSAGMTKINMGDIDDLGATKVLLRRFCNSEFGVFGDLILPDGQVLKTVERPWHDNQPSVSCIPAGIYECAPRPYYRGGYKAVEVKDVLNRSHILFHRGNTMRDVRGCIAI